jgi:iron complex transport system ATP-binding protein
VLKVNNLCLSYEGIETVKNVSFEIKKESITSMIGPNGCGKSTIFKALSKSKRLDSGDIWLQSKSISKIDSKALARRMSILPQSPIAPDDFTTRDLIGYGRYPHLNWTGKLHKKDYEIIDWAITETKLEKLQHRKIITLSGGERQRAWIAMALAQQPDILLLDEPTTFLDICHQFELLELIKRLNQQMGLTIVMVLHDINQAARYSDKIIVIKDGQKYKEGKPYEIVTKSVLEDVFNIEVKVFEDNENGCPYFIPIKNKAGNSEYVEKLLRECS